MAKSKRSKIKQANRAVARETLKNKELERLKATCLSLHRTAGFSQSFPDTLGNTRKIQHGGFQPITTYVPTPNRPKKFAVHLLEGGRYIQREPSAIVKEEQEETTQPLQVSCSFYEDITKQTETVSSQDNDRMEQVVYIRANEGRRRRHNKKRKQSLAIHKNRRTKHPHNKTIRMAF